MASVKIYPRKNMVCGCCCLTSGWQYNVNIPSLFFCCELLQQSISEQHGYMQHYVWHCITFLFRVTPQSKMHQWMRDITNRTSHHLLNFSHWCLHVGNELSHLVFLCLTSIVQCASILVGVVCKYCSTTFCFNLYSCQGRIYDVMKVY